MIDVYVKTMDCESRIAASFAQQKVMAYLGAELSSVSPGRCEIKLPYRDELTQQNGYFHAGIIATIADSAAGYAGLTVMPADAGVLSVEYKINLLAPADGELLIARGEVVRAGRTLVICRADVEVLKSGQSKLCATMLQTLMTMRGKGQVPR